MAARRILLRQAQASAAIAVAIKDLGADAETAKLIRRGLKELAR
jgi:Holliday junction DNA helicase RuvA